VTLPVDIEYNLLRIMQEAISNAVRHSGARTIEVALRAAAGSMRLTVKDDGMGFAVSDVELNRPGHYGLIGMRERASQIRAALNLESVPGAGTTVRLEVPVPEVSHGLVDDVERAE
jgi:signal transduction histidine kinase